MQHNVLAFGDTAGMRLELLISPQLQLVYAHTRCNSNCWFLAVRKAWHETLKHEFPTQKLWPVPFCWPEIPIAL
jgi:hypothetical protein